MSRESVSRIIGNIDDRYISEATAACARQETVRPALRRIKRFAPAAVAACLVLTFGAWAYGSGIVSRVFGWGNNFEITMSIDENGDPGTVAVLHTDSLTDPVRIDGGKMTFIVNDVEIDITTDVSVTKAYRYEYTDEDGNIHVWLVGLLSDDISHYGYAEFIKAPSGEWIGGYSARINIEADGSTSAKWLNAAKSELNIPW